MKSHMFARIFPMTIQLTLRFFWTFLLLIILLPITQSQAFDLKSNGGEQLLSGHMEFTESWRSSVDSRKRGLWWNNGDYYTLEQDRNYQPWEDAVKNAVSPLVGQIVATGPCSICLTQKGSGAQYGARIKMFDSETGGGFIPCSQDNLLKSGIFNHGFVPAGVQMTIDVFAVMGSYNNMVNTGEFAYPATQDVEYEVWYYPRGDGSHVQVISTGANQWDKPQPGTLYFTDKKCK